MSHGERLKIVIAPDSFKESPVLRQSPGQLRLVSGRFSPMPNTCRSLWRGGAGMWQAPGMGLFPANSTVIAPGGGGLGRLANQQGIPVITMAGCLGEGAELVLDHGVTTLFPILPDPGSLEDTLIAAEENLRATARNIAAEIF